MAKNNVKPVKYVTGKGELTGFIAIMTPSTKFNKQGDYTANILLSKEEGEKLEALMKDVRTEQFKTYGKGTKAVEITACKPYATVDENTGEEIPDPQGRYILKTKAKAYIENGQVTKKIMVVDSKCNIIKNASIGEGTIAKLGILIGGYSVAGKTGISVKLGKVQIIDLVSYSSDNSFDMGEEDGFIGTEENFKEAPVKLTTGKTTEEPDEVEEDEEEDF